MNRRELLRKIDRLVGGYICLAAYVGGRGVGAASSVVRRRAAGEGQGFRNVLLIKLVGRGDTVLMLPTARALREHLPQARLSILLTPLSTGAFMAGVDVDEVIVYDILGKDAGVGGFVRLVMALRKRRFDLVIDYEQHIKLVTLVSYLTGARERVGFVWGDGRRGLLFTRRVPLNERAHMAEGFADLVRAARMPCDVGRLAEVHVPGEDEAFVDRWLLSRGIASGDVVVAIHAGSGGSALARRWPAERFAHLADSICQRYGARVLLTGTLDEMGLIEGVTDTMVEKPVVAAGEFSFRQVAALLKRCSLAIGNDTGVVHVAAAMGTPVVALFGPNLPLRYGPIGEGHAVLYKGVECSPCINIHQGQIGTCDAPVCIRSISLEEVWQVVQERLDVVCEVRSPQTLPLRRVDGEWSVEGAAGEEGGI